MNEAYEFLQQMNWFLTPVSNAILYLFTTKSGFTILIILLVSYLSLSIANKLRVRRIALKAVSEKKNIPLTDILYIVGSELMNVFLKIIANIPVLLGIIIFLFAIVGMSATFRTVDDFFGNQQKIRELQTVVKHLDKSYKVAKIKIVEYNETTNMTDLDISFYDYEKKAYNKNSQNIKIKGHDIYFLSYVLNFEYSEIVTNAKKNIVIPYKIFSEEVPKDKGILLQVKDSLGIPYAFHRAEEDIYGISKTTFDAQLLKISEYMTNGTAAKKAGIRSFWGNYVHYNKPIYKGLTLIVWVEQTGGIILKETNTF